MNEITMNEKLIEHIFLSFIIFGQNKKDHINARRTY